LYFYGILKWLAVCVVSEEMLNCKLLSTQAAASYSICILHDVMEIANGQPWQNSSQNWRGAECHCQVNDFLLHKINEWLKVSLELQIHY
jgi:hypothetical protein